MTTKATTATRCNSIPAAVAIVAVGASLIGCADHAALMYVHDAHARKVAAWCYTVSGARTARNQEDCVHRAWDSVPHTGSTTMRKSHLADAGLELSQG